MHESLNEQEYVSNALQGAVMGMLWIALIFVLCLKGCFGK